MQMLSDDDRNLREMTTEELARAWDLWFDLAQTTNDSDPPYTHGVFVAPRRRTLKEHPPAMPDVGADSEFERPTEPRRSG